MKAYKLEVLVIDNEQYGANEVKDSIENNRYFFNSVMSIKQAEIGEWHDDHPLNKSGTMAHAYYNLDWEAAQ